MRLMTRTTLAMRTLMLCASNPDQIVRKQDVAETCVVSENHLAQVIHMLGQKGFLHTLRGRSGGLTLGRPADQITVGDVFRAIEGQSPLTECFAADRNTCPLVSVCRLKCVLAEAQEAFYARLDGTTVADLVAGNDALQDILKVA